MRRGALTALLDLGGEALLERSGDAQAVAELARDLDFADVDGNRPPSIRSLALVGPEHLPAAEAFASGAAAAAGGGGKENGATLRLDDRSWWRMLHFLEAEVRPAQFCAALFCGAQFCGAILADAPPPPLLSHRASRRR